MFKINIQLICDKKNLPKKSDIILWSKYVLLLFFDKAELTIRLVSTKEMKNLNFKYRKRNFPTNVLAFPYENEFIYSNFFLGDIVICKQIIEIEAFNQKKKLNAHWAHIIIHGLLHLIGFDHTDIRKSCFMEKIEIKILKHLGFDNPYF